MISDELMAKLRVELVRDEDDRRRPYRCTAGHLTAGIGHNLEAKDLSDAVVDLWFSEDVKDSEDALDAIEPRWRQLDGDRQRVLLNMAFNLGEFRLRGFKAMWKAIGAFLDGFGAHWLTVAAEEMIDSKWSRQVGERAHRLADRMRVKA